MEENIRLYEEQREMLLRFHKEVMDKIRAIDDKKLSEDSDLREFVNYLMGDVRHFSNHIKMIDYKIRELKRTQEGA